MSVEKILEERQKTHGEFTSHAAITQALKAIVHNRKNWDSLSVDKKESIDMILHKIGRILNGNAATKDHWDDIAGYATLVANTLVVPEGIKHREEKVNMDAFISSVAMMARFGTSPIDEIISAVKTNMQLGKYTISSDTLSFKEAMDNCYLRAAKVPVSNETLFSKQESV